MFRGMRYVYAVYKEQSFTKAAQKLYVSQPSLSASVKRVEREVGSELFERGFSSVRLTEAGKHYIEAVEQILDIEEQFENKINDLNTLQTGKITVGGSNYVCSCILAPIVRKFSEKYPNVEIEIIESNSTDLHKRVLNDEIDVVVDSFEYDSALFDGTALCAEAIYLAVPSSFEINKKLKKYAFTDENPNPPPVNLKYFSKCGFILLKEGNDMRSRADTLLKNSGFTPQIDFQLDRMMTSFSLISSGMGIGFITDKVYKKSFMTDMVTLYSTRASGRTLYLVRKRSKYVTKAILAFHCDELDKASYKSEEDKLDRKINKDNNTRQVESFNKANSSIRINIIAVKEMNKACEDIVWRNATGLFSRAEAILNVVLCESQGLIFIPAHFGFPCAGKYYKVYSIVKNMFSE